ATPPEPVPEAERESTVTPIQKKSRNTVAASEPKKATPPEPVRAGRSKTVIWIVAVNLSLIVIILLLLRLKSGSRRGGSGETIKK
ncbi:MAG TPA: hypothetical protein VK137_01930, partial [Planctomycetaceae bacterium]|nr:hypothetical protein [Planctomycetaceae bacterium]